MNATQDTRALFLEEFIKRTIIKSQVSLKTETKEDLFGKLDEFVVAAPKLEIEHKKIEQPKIIEPVITKKPEQAIKPGAVHIKTQEMPKLPPIKLTMPPAPQVPSMQKITIMDRLNRIFADPAVQVLNCPGPNKNILITRQGRVQPSQILFSEEEIKNFMKELSEKTKIPLIPGLIKVIFQNLIITSVISEFVGTKFVAERRQQGPLQAPARIQFR